MNIVPYYQPQQGLNGWLGRWAGKAIKAAGRVVASYAELIPIVGHLIATKVISMADNFADSEGVQNLRTAIQPAEPTAAETIILDAWLEKFKIWGGNLMTELADAANKTTVAQKIAAINIVLNKIHTVLDYYEVYETEGLSQNAINNRSSVIYETLKPVNEGIAALVASYGGEITKVTTTVNPASYNFSPLFTTVKLTLVSGDNYKVSGTRSNTIGILPIATAVATSVGGTKPTTVIPIPTVTTPVSTNTPNVPTTDPIKTVNPATTVPTTVAPEKKSMAGTLVILAAVGGIAYYAFKGGSKPKAAAKKTTTKKTTKK